MAAVNETLDVGEYVLLMVGALSLFGALGLMIWAMCCRRPSNPAAPTATKSVAVHPHPMVARSGNLAGVSFQGLPYDSAMYLAYGQGAPAHPMAMGPPFYPTNPRNPMDSMGRNNFQLQLQQQQQQMLYEQPMQYPVDMMYGLQAQGGYPQPPQMAFQPMAQPGGFFANPVFTNNNNFNPVEQPAQLPFANTAPTDPLSAPDANSVAPPPPSTATDNTNDSQAGMQNGQIQAASVEAPPLQIQASTPTSELVPPTQTNVMTAPSPNASILSGGEDPNLRTLANEPANPVDPLATLANEPPQSATSS